MPTQRQKLVAHHVIGLEKSISATAKQIGASPTSVRGSLISYCIKMMPSLEPELTAWVEHKDRGRHRLAVIRAHKDQLMPSVDQPTRRKPMSEEQQAVETAAENCEVLRARLAKYEDADGNPKAQPSGVVLEDDALSDLASSACQEALSFGIGEDSFMRLARTVRDRCARLNQPASAGDERATLSAFTAWGESIGLRPALQTVGELKAFKAGAEWKVRAALSANHSEQVLEGWQLVPVEPIDAMLEAGDKYIGTPATYKAMLSACPSPAITKDFSQFLSAVMDAAGLIRHGRQSKELSEYLGMKCMEYRGAAPSAGSQEQG